MKFLIPFLCLALPMALLGSETSYDNPVAGISLTKPAAWHMTALDLGKSGQRLNDPALDALLKQKQYMPVVTITKYPEPYEDVNPSFLVSFKPMGRLYGRTAEEVLGVLKNGLAQSVSNFEVRRDVSKVVCGGLAGAEMQVAYIIKTPDGKQLTARSRMICLTRGEFFIQITTGTGSNPDSDTEEALNAMIASLKIQE